MIMIYSLLLTESENKIEWVQIFYLWNWVNNYHAPTISTGEITNMNIDINVDRNMNINMSMNMSISMSMSL